MRRAFDLAKLKASMLAMRVIPDGANDLLPELPSEPIDPEDDGEQKLWDRLMPEYRGLLRAEVRGARRYE